jgi:hypothetical protein
MNSPRESHMLTCVDLETVTVHIGYHVEINKHRYSVPHALVGLKLDAPVTAGAVELLHRGRRVASHARNDRAGG